MLAQFSRALDAPTRSHWGALLVLSALGLLGHGRAALAADTTPPTVPTGLAASAITGNEISLSWIPSTDNVGVAGYHIERCQGSGCSTFSQIATSAGTGYRETGLVPSTSYTYRIRAFDAAANLSGYSNVATATSLPASGGAVGYSYDELGRLKNASYNDGSSINYSLDGSGNRRAVTVPDILVPTAPGTPTITNIAAATASATWTAASDNIGVAAYEYQLNGGAWVSAGTALTANLAGLSPITAYTITVHAKDAAGNTGPTSTASFTTIADTIPPSAPSAPTFSAIQLYQVTASWTAATDNVGVVGYEYQIGSGAWQTVGNVLSVTITGLTLATRYTVSIHAMDAAGNKGPASSGSFTTASDTIPPTAPGVPSIASITDQSAAATWTAATDNVGVTSYQYQLNGGSWVSVGMALSLNLTSLVPHTAYTINVRAMDAAGNPSSASAAGFTTLADTTPPSAPGTPAISNLAMASATVTWTAATDDVGVVTYQYQLNGGAWVNVGNVLTTNLTGLSAWTNYSIAVRALDATGNAGASSTNSFKTPDTQPPSAPGALSFTNLTPTSATVSWGAATDNVSVAGYQYTLNNGAPVNAGNVLSVSFAGLAAATTYSIVVKAVDEAGNIGPTVSGSFATLPYSDQVTMTEGKSVFGSTMAGFDSPLAMGSMSNTKVTGGESYWFWYDFTLNAAHTSYVAISGFSADPGSGWLLSATAGGVTQQGASATYTYSSGLATWQWAGTQFGLSGSGTVGCTLVHR